MSLSGETEISNLDNVIRRCRGRRHEGGVSSERVVIIVMRGCRNEDVFGFDVAMEEVVGVNVFKTLHDLIENALDTRVVEALVISRLHQLVKVALHVLHANMQLLAVGIQENVESRNEVRMCGEGS